MSIRYCPMESPHAEFFDVAIYGSEVDRLLGTPITVPKYYWEHLRRFLWRHHVYMQLYASTSSGVKLPASVRSVIKLYIQYMDGIAEGLLTTAGRRRGDPGYRSYLFNMYLVVDFHVGRHEHHVVSSWAAEHPDIIIECVDIDTIGKCSAV